MVTDVHDVQTVGDQLAVQRMALTSRWDLQHEPSERPSPCQLPLWAPARLSWGQAIGDNVLTG